MKFLYLDYETWSAVKLSRGTDVYLDNARPLIATWAFGDGPVQSHDFTEDDEWLKNLPPVLPKNLRKALEDPDTIIVAHNAFFDRNVTKKCFRFELHPRRWHCTYAQAMSHGLPGGLGPLCEVLDVPTDQAKDKDGMRLMRKFCGPHPLVKDDDWPKFIDYAVNDITGMRECHKRMPNWNYIGDEKKLWEVDQTINDRGFAIDQQFAIGAVAVLQTNKDALADATKQATGGIITAATQRDKLLMYLCEHQGCVLADLTASTINLALEDESLDETTKTLLRIRLESSKSSTSKFKRLLDSVGSGGRLRGTLQYAGASRTARWAGRIFQPHNLPRPSMHAADIRRSIELIREGFFDLVTLFAPIGKACSNGLRGLVISGPGKKLVVSDWSSIEGRGLAWVAGEEWKLKAFRDGADLYILGYEKAFNLLAGTVKKGDIRRQHGKVMELALGYGGGVGAFLNMAAAYDVDLDELGRMVPSVAPEDVMEKANRAWDRAVEESVRTGKDTTFGLSQEAYVACDALKIMYRRANPAIAKYWTMLENAAREVIRAKDPKHKVQVGRVVFDCDGKWMRIKLPSGRYLSYALPRVHKGKIDKKTGKERPGAISYMSWRNKHWSRTLTYGGKLAENIVQAISRDLLGYLLIRLAALDIDVVLHIHDEIITEVLETLGFGVDELNKLMKTGPRWAVGLPLNAEGFEGYRYEKK